MNNVKITIIIKSDNYVSAIDSLLRQDIDNFECFIINNEKGFKSPDTRFKTKNINDVIKDANGDYILFLKSNNILIPDTIKNISRVIDFTNADIIKFNSDYAETDVNSNEKNSFRYMFNKGNIIDYISDSLSEFCFKKDIIKNIDLNLSEHTFLIDALLKAKDITIIDKKFLINKKEDNLCVQNIIENYKINKNNLSKNFWKTYFKITTPKIVLQTINMNDKKSFVEFCHQIPLCLIPLRYRIICYILKKTNK